MSSIYTVSLLLLHSSSRHFRWFRSDVGLFIDKVHFRSLSSYRCITIALSIITIIIIIIIIRITSFHSLDRIQSGEHRKHIEGTWLNFFIWITASNARTRMFWVSFPLLLGTTRSHIALEALENDCCLQTEKGDKNASYNFITFWWPNLPAQTNRLIWFNLFRHTFSKVTLNYSKRQIKCNTCVSCMCFSLETPN